MLQLLLPFRFHVGQHSINILVENEMHVFVIVGVRYAIVGTILCWSIILAVCGIPFGIESVYIDITANVQKSDLEKAADHLITQIMRLFYHATFMSTFCIYLYMSNDVRNALMKRFRNNRTTPINPMTLQTFRISIQ